MGSVEPRHEQAAKACLLLRRLPSEAQSRGWTADEEEHRRREVLGKIEELCAPEIIAAVLGDYTKAGLCGIYIGVVHEPPYTTLYILREDTGAINTGISRAVSSSEDGTLFYKRVENNVASSILEESRELKAELSGARTQDLLELCSKVSLRRGAFVIEHLDEEQRASLSMSLRRALGGKPIPMRMDQEPNLPANPTRKQRYYWWHWYILRRAMQEPHVREALGGVPRIVIAEDEDKRAKKRGTGEMVDPLGPIWVKQWSALSRELNRRGHPIKDPESKNRLARSLGISRSTVQRYLDANVPVTIEPDGEGGVVSEFDMKSLLQALDVSSRKKRKPPGQP